MTLRILVVDDHEPVRRAITSLLAKRGDWQVCGQAADGLEAVERANELRPDAVLMDVSMPNMDGLQATHLVRQQLPGARIIIVSQNESAVVREQAEQAGADGYVGKNVIAEELIPSIEKLFAAKANAEGNPNPSASRNGEEISTWLSADGEMGELIRTTDWSRTPLGATTTWSPALRMIVKFLLANRFPQLLWWGPEFCSIYNDAYIPILGSKHPWAVGRPVREVWNEIWHVLKPLIEVPFSGGPATWMEDIPLEINRKGFFEETHFTIAYSPVPDETVSGGIGGVLATVHEITEKVVGERRVRALRDLGARSVEPKSAEEACIIVRETLSPHSKDIPFLLLYLLDENRQNARLGCRIGAEAGDRACLESVDVSSQSEESWPLFDVLATEDIELVRDLNDRFDRVPQGPWSDAPTSAAVLPIRSNIPHQLAGFMVAGLSSRIQFDKSYRDFLELMSTQIATTIANARAYEEERKRAEALAEIDRAKTLFFSNVSHEFRTPLTLMLGPLEDVLSEPNGLAPRQHERLNIAHRNSMRLLKLVNTLLDFSRIEAGRFQTSYEPVDLAQLTSDLASVFRSVIEKAGLQFIVTCPKLEQPVYVDRELWEKIVFNLLSNAFKFTFEGEIEISVQKNDAAAELAVRDTGTGIPAEDLPHLFKRFYRVKNAHGRTFEGSGIGLALVQELAKQNGGSVRVESEIGIGSTFTVIIPMGKDHLPAERIGAQRSLASTALGGETYVEEALYWLPDLPSGKESPTKAVSSGYVSTVPGAEERHRILLADDNADMREYVRKLLSPTFEVEVVPDGERALEAIRAHPPELVLSDVMMPKLDGFGLLKELRSDPRTATIPFIMLSARAGEESRIEGVAAGASDYLCKPFSARELLARVNSHLKMARLLRESNERNERQRRLYQTILSSTPDLVYVFDLNHRFTYANEALLRMWGKTWDDAIGRNCLELGYEPWHATMHDQEIEQVIATRKPIRGEVPFIGTNGRRIYDYIFVPVIGPGGEVEAIAGTTRDITELKQTQDALGQSEARLRAIYDGTHEYIGLLAPDGTLLDCNRASLDFGDNTREDVVGRPFWETVWFVHTPGAPEKLREAIARAATGEFIRYEAPLRRPAGEVVVFDFSLHPIRDEHGKVTFLVPEGREITDRKRAERALLEQARLLDLSNDAIFTRDAANRVTYWNRAATELYGFTREEAFGRVTHELLHTQFPMPLDKIVEQLHRDERWSGELIHKTKNGAKVVVISRWVLVREATGASWSVLETNNDITLQKHTERAMRESEERFRALVNATSYAVYRMSPDWTEMRQLEGGGFISDTGETRTDWLEEYIHPDDRQLVLRTIRDAVRSRSMFELEHRVRRTDGSLGWTYSRAIPRFDDAGEIIEWFGAASDVTARKDAEERYRKLAETLDAEVRARTRDLEQRNSEMLKQSEQVRELSWRLLRAQDEERRHIARELHDSAGQTLSVLGINLAQLVQKAGRNNPELANDAEIIQDMVQQLNHDIRTTSYLLHPPLLDESGLHSALSWYIQGLLERSGLQISLDVSQEFGRLPGDMELVVFRLVQECVTNIHRHSGSKTASIRIAREKDRVAVDIRDAGKGISPERLTEIQSGGSGVGIRGMRERLRQFKGELKIDSDAAGTRISVAIPVPRSAVPGNEAAPESLQPVV